MAINQNDNSLGALINSACPRNHKGLRDYHHGSLEIIFTDNLRKLNLQRFIRQYAGQEITYYCEQEEPTLFSKPLVVSDDANYVVITYTDQLGQLWTIEVFHPKFQEQEIGINRTDGHRTDRVMYAYSGKRQSLYLSKVNVSLRGDPKNRYQHDTVSIRLNEEEIPQQVRFRLQHHTVLKRDPAYKLLAKSNYQHLTQFEHVLSSYVSIGTKIVVGLDVPFSEEHDRFEDYVSTFEIVGHYYSMPLEQSFVRQIQSAGLNHTSSIVETVASNNGFITLGNVKGDVLEVDLDQIPKIGFVPLSFVNCPTHLEQLFEFGRTQIEACLRLYAQPVVVVK